MGSPPVLDCSVLALVAVDLPGVLPMVLSLVVPHHRPLMGMPWCAHEGGWNFVVLPFVVQSFYHQASSEYSSSSWHFTEVPAQWFWRRHVLVCLREHTLIFLQLVLVGFLTTRCPFFQPFSSTSFRSCSILIQTSQDSAYLISYMPCSLSCCCKCSYFPCPFIFNLAFGYFCFILAQWSLQWSV